MRQLGSFFHVAMNGMAASDKIFRLLDLPEREERTETVSEDCSIVCSGLCFSYRESDPSDADMTPQNMSRGSSGTNLRRADKSSSDGTMMGSDEGASVSKEREVLHDVRMEFPKGGFISIVGESGCGKSTMAAILTGRNQGYGGSVKIGGVELSDIGEEDLMKNITYVSHQSYLFKGTVRENLLMGKPDAPDPDLWAVLERVNLADFLRDEQGLDTVLSEKASNLSGGQCQRLALARALLHDSPVYIFDEATSNIDVESENDIMREIHSLAGKKTVILISHRLANVTASDNIYVMEKGKVAENGSHEELLARNGVYAGLWNVQQSLENYGNQQEYPDNRGKYQSIGEEGTMA